MLQALASVPLSSSSTPTKVASGALDLDAGLTALGLSSFRPGQREAIETLLAERKLLLVAPTGGGKSLCYQLPATLLSGTTLVVSPLIALMHDQVAALAARGVAATYIASTLPREEVRARLESLARGELRLAYIAPERLADAWFRSSIQRVTCPLIAIDEAHCISEWGHDFRPEYLEIRTLLELIPNARVLACTATATPVVRDEIVSRLGLPADTPQIVRGFARDNLALAAREYTRKAERQGEVDRMLSLALGSPASEAGTAIVYSPTRKLAEEEAERLSAGGWRARAYHAGLTPERRNDVQRAFIAGELQVVVATNAFGMGIDRGDVRAVVHLGPPSSLEAYYQEVGRAGRDGQPAYGLMLHTGSDLPLRRRLIEMPVEGREPDPSVVEHKWNQFLELMRWAEGGSCRHDAILRYFGDEAESLGGCGKCDVCQNLAEPGSDELDAEQRTTLVRKVLSGVARVHGRFGLSLAIKLLRGEPDPRLERNGLDRVTTFGVLADRPGAWLSKVVQRCVTAGWVSFSGGERPVIALTPRGARVMKGELPARIVLPELSSSSERRPTRSRRRNTDADDVALDAAGQALFEALRAHRMLVARESAVPAYVVATDRSLRDMALLKPASPSDLGMVFGMGPAKIERYGQGFLDVIRRFVAAT